jgi:hypothetical protein
MKTFVVIIIALFATGCAPRIPSGYTDASRPAALTTIIVAVNNRGMQ